MAYSKTVNDYLKKNSQWEKELIFLREIMLEFKFEESIKWGAPVYAKDGKNLIGLGAFKAYVGLWFFQGGLLKDTDKVLQNAQEGKTKAMRQWRFQSINEMDKKLIKKYVTETIENHDKGLKIKPERKKTIETPDILKTQLEQNSTFQKAYNQLKPGQQREYAEYIAEAKQETTKQRRLEKITPMVMKGIGLNDKYKK